MEESGVWNHIIYIGLLYIFGIFIISITAYWKIFKKAGQRGWAAIIPVYNTYVMSQIAFGNSSYFIASIILAIVSITAQFAEISILTVLTMIAAIILAIFYYIRLCKVFGKSGGFAVALIFFPFIFLPVLAFGNFEYIGPEKTIIE